jgi:hypothetical protein
MSTPQWMTAVALTIGMGTLMGCFQDREPPDATVSWLAPETRAAKPSDCAMPMLNAMPNADFQEIAIIEVTDDYTADDQEVLGLAQRKACETGADALAVLENKHQEEGKRLPGANAEEGKHSGPDSASSSKGNDHTPELGEEGHRARFFNGAAIIYKTAPLN